METQSNLSWEGSKLLAYGRFLFKKYVFLTRELSLINTLLEGRSRNINSQRRKPESINIRIRPTTKVLLSDNLPVRKSY